MKHTTAKQRAWMVDVAIAHLREARNLLTLAHAPKTLERTRLALSSAKGARRHAQNREGRLQ